MSDGTRIQRGIESDGSWPSFALPHGTVVNGYRIERVLGSGGFGITYLAFDLLQQRFAIKEYYPRQFATRQHMTVQPTSREDAKLFEECRERFLREAQALVHLGRVADASDGIVRVKTYFEALGTCFLVMDYVEGDSLAGVFRDEPSGLSSSRVRSLLTQLLSSIRVVHRAGLVHRDIKPANVILREDDRLVLIDFGSTRQAMPGENTSFTQIYSGGYGPPEQMIGLPQGEFSDIYAIGAVCYRAIGGSVVDALARQNSLAAGRLDPQPSAVSIGAGRYPKPLLTAIDAALAVNPAQRPQTADAMLALLGPDQPVDMPGADAAGRVSAGARTRRGAWVAAAGAGVVVLAAAGYFMLSQPVAPPTPVTAPAEIAAVPDHPQAPPTATPAPMPVLPTQPPPQQEATAVPPQQQEPVPAPPPPAPSVPPPAPAVPSPAVSSPFEQAVAGANSLPCSVLRLTAERDGVRAFGFASAGQDLDRFLADLHNVGRVADNVARVDRSACPVLATAAPVVRGTWNAVPPILAVRLDQPNVAVGARVAIGVTTTLAALYLDLYDGDGSVRHLLRPGQSGAIGRRTVEWTAASPPGPRLIVAFGAATPLELGQRPEIEPAAGYLDALRARIDEARSPLAADLAMVIVRAVEPAVVKVPQLHSAPVRSQKCANIVSRAQLGETLSDAELAVLRTECRS
jgi:predicted Ser/Thr protein kinase